MIHALRVGRDDEALRGIYPASRGTCAALRGMPAPIALLVLAAISVAQANNITVTNVSLARQDTVTRTANVMFDLAWDNSWRAGDNCRDAAWVFVKFRRPGSNNWEHAELSTNSGHHSASNGVIAAVPDGKGVFIYSSTNHTGSASYPRTTLRWNYGLNGCAFAAGAAVEVSVHAIEMVYIPAGAFFLGSGGATEVGYFYRCVAGGSTTNGYPVSSETNAITAGTNSGNLCYSGSGDGTGIISNLFPKGFAAFYCMKYEISQGQYAAFLNKLTGTQWSNRFYTAAIGGVRYTISGLCTNSTATAPNLACSWMSWADVSAYADWAALRPMTELEYEKACRGTERPLPNEYAWGNATAVEATGYDGTDLSGTETPNPTNANCHFNGGLNGPARVGVFARPNASRSLSGASYYGVMELSGNMPERAVTVGTNTGRAFMGTHGDGVLAANGDATNNPDWPGTNAVGAGFRGGGYNRASTEARVSDRVRAATADAVRNTANTDYGGRAVRTAP